MKHINNSLAFTKCKRGQQNKPLITVVTVVFNGNEFLEETIQSVIGQTYDNLEYIIIDGGSIDGTLNIIKKYEDKIDCWVSEPDKGIYDAMNKGIQIAKGEWINFMNAGDTFGSPDILTTVFDDKKYHEEILYGDVHIRYPDFSRIQRAGKPDHLWRGMQFCHQSVFVKSVVHKLNPFNTANLIAADLQFYYESHKNNLKFNQVDIVIASVLADGISQSNRIRAIDAWRDAVCAVDCTLPIRLYYLFLKIDATIRNLLKQILPKKVTKAIIMSKK